MTMRQDSLKAARGSRENRKTGPQLSGLPSRERELQSEGSVCVSVCNVCTMSDHECEWYQSVRVCMCMCECSSKQVCSPMWAHMEVHG